MEQYWDQQQWASNEELGRPPPRKLASRDSGNIMRSLLKQDQTEDEQSCKTSRRGQGEHPPHKYLRPCAVAGPCFGGSSLSALDLPCKP